MEKKPGASKDETMTTIERPKKQGKPSAKNSNMIVTVVVIIVLVLVAGYLLDKYTSLNLFGGSQDNGVVKVDGTYVADGVYKAVFLSNGQVYFGRVDSRSEGETVLVDIYYLQVSEPLQQQPSVGEVQQPQLSLIKLGNELHGPVDKMVINNDHILFTEDLKEDGKVAQAIAGYATEDAEAQE